MNEKGVRERAKALGIRNWHNRKIDKLIDLVSAQDEKSMESSQVIISFDSFFASASKELKAEAVEYLDSIEILSNDIDFCLWLEQEVRLGRFVRGTGIDVLWRFWNRDNPYYEYDRFLLVLEAFVFLAKNDGWSLVNDCLCWKSIPSLTPSWHAKRWIELSSSIDRERAKAIFGVLFGA